MKELIPFAKIEQKIRVYNVASKEERICKILATLQGFKNVPLSELMEHYRRHAQTFELNKDLFKNVKRID